MTGIALFLAPASVGIDRRRTVVHCKPTNRQIAVATPNPRSALAIVEYIVDEDTGEEFVEWWIDDKTDVLCLSVLVLSLSASAIGLYELAKSAKGLWHLWREKADEDATGREQEKRQDSEMNRRKTRAAEIKTLNSRRDELRDDVLVIRRRLDYVSGETWKAKEELEKNIQKVQEARSAALETLKAKESPEMRALRTECEELEERVRGINQDKSAMEENLTTVLETTNELRLQKQLLETELDEMMANSEEIQKEHRDQLLEQLKEQQKLVESLSERLRKQRSIVQTSINNNPSESEQSEEAKVFQEDIFVLQKLVYEAGLEVEKLRDELGI
ncbi:hypothetical protein NDN08_003657 [Rhodosorus marinus]|uniref:Uncharacterized protein n=1 Tax=Rhodosorus marinus TaxID=101924 RepID=A0AAV8UX48_9RHOD|nr:hypothetical protein NDN08_003657 [Rhodosorus marinus]